MYRSISTTTQHKNKERKKERKECSFVPKEKTVGLFVKFVQRRHVSEEVLARTEMGEGVGKRDRDYALRLTETRAVLAFH